MSVFSKFLNNDASKITLEQDVAETSEANDTSHEDVGALRWPKNLSVLHFAKTIGVPVELAACRSTGELRFILDYRGLDKKSLPQKIPIDSFPDPQTPSNTHLVDTMKNDRKPKNRKEKKKNKNKNNKKK